jgi:ABC-type bacteriocin/lantibiotic exporter with double-glycine peptidase domain
VSTPVPWRQRLRDALRSRRPLPFVQQVESADCGPACLASVLTFFGRDTRLRDVREALGTQRGTSARALVEGARAFGLRARGVQLEVHDLALLPRAAVLHWGFDHFVVLDRLGRRGVRLMDPAIGPRWVPHALVREKFTGVALLFEPSERFQPARVRRRELRGYFERLASQRPALVRTVVLSVVLQILALALPLLLGTLVDGVLPRRDATLLPVLALGLAVVVAFHVLTALLRGYLLAYLKTGLDAQLSLGFVDHLAQLPYAFFVQRAGGDLLARFESQRDLRQALTGATLSSVLDGGLVLGYVALLLTVSPALGALAIVLGSLQALLFLAMRAPTRDLAARELEAHGRAQARLVELLAGIETLKALGAEKRAVERWSHAFVDELNVGLARVKLGVLAGALAGGLALASPLVILLLGAWQVLAGQLSLGSMLALNALAAGFLGPLASLLAVGLQLQEARGHIERIEDVLGAPVEQAPGVTRPTLRLTGAIRLEQVSFRYGANEPWALRDLSVTIQAGQRVAIVGRSGAGKSTLARLLVGLYQPSGGRILYDGHDASALDVDSLRAQIGVVTQDARLFAASVRDNLLMANPDATPERLEQALRVAQLEADVRALPMGLDTLLADGGASLSGGQRQRLALARALVRAPAILLLDEATSDLDTVTEANLLAALAALPGTRISIAHRLSTVLDADLILVLDQGCVVESGRHAELLARAGIYATLVAAQITPST